MRYVDELSGAVRMQLVRAYRSKDLLGWGLRARLREGYTGKDFRADLIAALVVGVVALPLSMALAISSGVTPEHGLYTAIVAGVACALLGGTRFQVTGPTAAFVVILAPIVSVYGLGGLLVAGLMAGVILVGMGLARFGKLMQFVPHPVTTGFTMGIAVTIAILQLKDIFGVLPCSDAHALAGACLRENHGTLDHVAALWEARGGFHAWDGGAAALMIGLMVAVPRLSKRIPAALVALVVVTLVVLLLGYLAPADWGFQVATIGSRFHTTVGGQIVAGIPPLPPLPMVPWHAPDAHGREIGLDYTTLRDLLPSAFAIAMLGAIESLMAAVVGDGMSGSRHEPDAELIALGIGNILCPLFGGIAATGALARTATNIRAGARSPLAAAMHAIFVLACTIALAPLVAYLPMAALAGLLVVVARNMSEARHFVRLLKIAPRNDVLVMVTCFGLTVAFDMVIAVTVGVMLAALLFMKRMSVLTKVDLESPASSDVPIPDGVRLYEIAGPMFFGAAKSAMEQLHGVGAGDHTYILDMKHVPTMDATGLVALESVLDRLRRSHVNVIFAGLTAEVSEILDRAGLKRDPGKLAYAPDVPTAVSMAIVHAAQIDAPERGLKATSS